MNGMRAWVYLGVRVMKDDSNVHKALSIEEKSEG